MELEALKAQSQSHGVNENIRNIPKISTKKIAK